jgi:hypothetical protein
MQGGSAFSSPAPAPSPSPLATSYQRQATGGARS